MLLSGRPRLTSLDGLRGLAVLAVLGFHGGVSWLPGGFLGVDAFFVLSGFLITTLLVEEWRRHGRVRLGRFWSRRARRLLPALLGVLGAVALYARLVAVPEARPALRLDALATLAYVVNWRFAFSGGDYFAQAALPSPLLHAWSLAVEEQFYVVWPLVVAVVLRARRPLQALQVVSLLGAVASSATMILMEASPGQLGRLYYGTDTRVQAVLVGATLAAFLAGSERHRSPLPAASRRLLGALALVATAATGWAWAALTGHESWLYGGGFTIAALAVAAILAAVVLVPAGVLGRVLSLRPLAATGRISYGLYLWHWPVFLTLNHERTGLAGAALLGARVAVTAAFAVLSHRLIEQPVLAGRLPRRQALLALPGALIGLVAVLVAATSVPEIQAPPVAALPGPSPDPAPPAEAVSASPSAAGFPTPPPAEPPAPPAPAAPAVNPARIHPDPRRVLVLGDSVAMTLAQGLPSGEHGVTVVNAAELGCGLVRGGPYRYFGAEYEALPQCQDWPRIWGERVAAHDPDVVFVLVGRWEVMDRVHAGRWTGIGEPEYDAYLTEELEQLVPVLTARGAKVALATAPYYRRGERPDGGTWSEDDPRRVDRFNQLVREFAAGHPDHVRVIPLGEQMSEGPEYTSTVGGLRLRYDGVHVTQQGSRWLAPWLLPQLYTLGEAAASGAPASLTTPPSSRDPPSLNIRAR